MPTLIRSNNIGSLHFGTRIKLGTTEEQKDTDVPCPITIPTNKQQNDIIISLKRNLEI